MPRLWILSDLHLEAVPHPEAFSPAAPDFDILIVAGDVAQGNCEAACRTVARLAAGKPAIFVLGNHEHRNGEVRATAAEAGRAAKRYDLVLLDNDEADVDGVRFIGGTMWGDFANSDPSSTRETGERIEIAQSSGGHFITIADTVALHRNARTILENRLARPRDGRPVVVVTHHAPLMLCMPEQFRRTWMTGLSCSNLEHLTDTGRVDLWIHGHIHDNVDLRRPGGTRIVCNPAATEFRNTGFIEDLVIEV